MDRRGFITGLISLVAAPAIVRAGSLMPIKRLPIIPGNVIYVDCDYDGFEDGTWLKPWKTIQGAMDYIGRNFMFEPVTVQVAKGEYAGFEYRPPGPTHNIITIRGSGPGLTLMENRMKL